MKIFTFPFHDYKRLIEICSFCDFKHFSTTLLHVNVLKNKSTSYSLGKEIPPKIGITEIQNISLNKQTSIVYLAVPIKTKRHAGHEINFFSDSHLAPKFFKVVAK